MILADVYTLLNDLFFESVRLIVILVAVIVAVICGAAVRKAVDKKKAAKELTASEEQGKEIC